MVETKFLWPSVFAKALDKAWASDFVKSAERRLLLTQNAKLAKFCNSSEDVR